MIDPLEKTEKPSYEDFAKTQTWVDDAVYLVVHLSGPLLAFVCLVGGGWAIISDRVPQNSQGLFTSLMTIGLGGGLTASALQKERGHQKLLVTRDIELARAGTNPSMESLLIQRDIERARSGVPTPIYGDYKDFTRSVPLTPFSSDHQDLVDESIDMPRYDASPLAEDANEERDTSPVSDTNLSTELTEANSSFPIIEDEV